MKLTQLLRRFARPDIYSLLMRKWVPKYKMPISGI